MRSLIFFLFYPTFLWAANDVFRSNRVQESTGTLEVDQNGQVDANFCRSIFLSEKTSQKIKRQQLPKWTKAFVKKIDHFDFLFVPGLTSRHFAGPRLQRTPGVSRHGRQSHGLGPGTAGRRDDSVAVLQHEGLLRGCGGRLPRTATLFGGTGVWSEMLGMLVNCCFGRFLRWELNDMYHLYISIL